MRAFAEVIADVGDLHEELTEALTDLVAQVKATRKTGTLKLTLKIKPNGENSVEIEDEVKLSLPAAPRPKSIMFIDGDNALRRTDPRQQRLPLREVAPEGRPLRDLTTTDQPKEAANV